MKKVFTTGAVAKLCNASPRLVGKWFDSGRLKGYRIPGSKDRRIPRECLIRFLKENGMPLGELEAEEWHKVLLIGTEALFIDRLKELLPECERDFRVEYAASGFEAGVILGDHRPDTIIIDFAMGRGEAVAIASKLKDNDAYESTLIVGLAGEDKVEMGHLTRSGTFSVVIKRPFAMAHLAAVVVNRGTEHQEAST